MATKEFIDDILAHIKENQNKITFNSKMFEIAEGDLLKHVELSLKKQFDKSETVEVAIQRASPINIWNKIIRKLSTLYSRDITRTTENPSDQELVDFYVKGGVDKHLGNFNENYNSYKWSTVEIYEDPELEKIDFRSIPSNQFLAYSDDKVNDMRPTAIIKFMGTYKDTMGVERNKYWIYTRDEFIPILDDGKIVATDLDGNEGINPFNVLPFEYLSMSEYLLVPMPDKDTFQMTVLIPVLITDQNFGSMQLSFPIIYTIDADAEKMPVSPNSFLNIKSDDPEKPANLGVVKASPDLQAQMTHVLRQLSIWLESRDISSDSIGKMDSNSFPSGIAKIISELDTRENRNAQILVFSPMETRFWKRLARIHNTLVDAGRLKTKSKFIDPEALEVVVNYQPEEIVESKTDKVARLKIEVEAGFKSKRKAIQTLNPKMSEDEIDRLMEEIDAEKTTVIIEEEPEETEENGVQTL